MGKDEKPTIDHASLPVEHPEGKSCTKKGEEQEESYALGLVRVVRVVCNLQGGQAENAKRIKVANRAEEIAEQVKRDRIKGII